MKKYEFIKIPGKEHHYRTYFDGDEKIFITDLIGEIQKTLNESDKYKYMPAVNTLFIETAWARYLTNQFLNDNVIENGVVYKIELGIPGVGFLNNMLLSIANIPDMGGIMYDIVNKKDI